MAVRRALGAFAATDIGRRVVPVLAEDAHFEVVVVARSGGVLRDRAWEAADRSGSGWPLVSRSIAKVLQVSEKPDRLEINILFGPRPVKIASLPTELPRNQIGIRGLALVGTKGHLLAALAPTEMIAQNLSAESALDKMLQRGQIRRDRVETGDVSLAVYESAQVLLEPDRPELARGVFRAASFTAAGDITQDRIHRSVEDMATWMVRQVHDDGRMTYKYWPSRGQESSANNSIRQVMATICLGRVAGRSGEPSHRDAADRNTAYLFTNHYRERDGLGFIWEYPGKAKLGAAALAGLAALEHPEPSAFEAELRALTATTYHLAESNGSFRTFLAPPDRNDNQNFYPGECLLFWSQLRRSRPTLYDHTAFMRAFVHYRDRFRRAPNPAFVPWHIQAYVLAWATEPDQELSGFVFEMADWLVPQQQWNGRILPDLLGRFYSPRHPEFGQPHASSTGVYLEGLIEAWWLAREVDDTARTESYRRTIVRALRNLVHLQFKNDDDMFYVSRTRPVFGGLRTEVYNNEIRVDNVQHCLMGAIRVLERFAQADYR